MIEFLTANAVIIAIAFAIGLIAGWVMIRAMRRTRIEGLGDKGHGRDVLDEGASPASRNSAFINAPPVAQPADSEPVAAAPAMSDDLTLIKGLGPKLAHQLVAMGITRFAEIGAWSEADIDRIDSQLGRFSGRIRRDNWVAQAKLLAKGAHDEFNAEFGKSQN